MYRERIAKNIIISVFTQLITLVLGMILPKLVLLTWGSEYNGLLSSVTSILGYLSLLEVGFNTATLQALYKSIGENDRAQTSSIVRTSQHYYHRMAILYAIIVAGIAVIYPLFIESSIGYWEIVLVIILQGAVSVINFAFRASYQQLLNAEGKYYVILLITLMTTLMSYGVKILAIAIFNNVLIMQSLSVVVIIIQIAVYSVYFKKRYNWIDKQAPRNDSLLKNRKYYFVQQIAGLIFNSTDTVVLSIFCGLKVASVYAVYNLVYSALAQIISLIRGSTNFVLGQSYHKNEELFASVYSIYAALQSTIGSIIASVAVLLIVSFIRLYTQGITDIDYVDYFAASLFSFNLILECSRGTSLASANIAGKAPETISHYITEAGINLVSSLMLVHFMGMRGVLIGTGLAGLYRTTVAVVYANKHILGRSALIGFKQILLNILLYLIIVYLGCNVIVLDITGYGELICAATTFGIIITMIFAICFLATNYRLVSGIVRSFNK